MVYMNLYILIDFKIYLHHEYFSANNQFNNYFYN